MTRIAAAILLSTAALPAQADCDYQTTREKALRSMRSYYTGPLTAESRTKSLEYYQRTFENAFRGDFDALRTVFRSPDCHSGDNEAWGDATWEILHIVGDTRFAAFLTRVPASERRQVIQSFASEGWFEHCGGAKFDGYFRRRFPETYIWFHRKT
jgi:hypothetical protein